MLQRLQVADVGTLLPLVTSCREELVETVGVEKFGLGAVARRWLDSGQLIDGDLARHVLFAEAGERRAAPPVAPVGAHPLCPRATSEAGRRVCVVDGDHAATLEGRESVAKP